MKLVPFIALLLFLLSCKDKTSSIDIIQQELTLEETVQSILSEEYLDNLKITEAERAFLFQFYEQRNFKPLWCNKKGMNQLGDSLMQLVQFPIQFGLSEKRLNTTWNKQLPLHNEIITIYNLARIYQDENFGMYQYSQKMPQPISLPSSAQLDSLLQFNSTSLAQQIIDWGPTDSTYQVMAKAMYHFAHANDLKEQKLTIPSFEEDSIQCKSRVQSLLVAKNYLDSTTQEDANQFQQALKKFQRENGCNPKGKITPETIRTISEANLHKAQRIALQLDKQRQKKAPVKTHIHLNIPEYMLRFYHEDTLASEHKIVVGKFENQTPELTAKLHSIVVYPYWNVPYSIASKEILPAAKHNPNYFEKNNMVLLRNNDTINPYKVNWKKIKDKTFPYKIVQQPGPKNSLGIIKFEFHNKFDVYFHDTPSKNYFNSVARTYSHGCMRTENPVELAKIILELEENKVTPDSLDTLLVNVGVNFPIKLKKQIPISIEYNTVLFPEDKVIFLRDVYHRDEEWIKILF